MQSAKVYDNSIIASISNGHARVNCPEHVSLPKSQTQKSVMTLKRNKFKTRAYLRQVHMPLHILERGSGRPIAFLLGELGLTTHHERGADETNSLRF
jgi:hypothetical protein